MHFRGLDLNLLVALDTLITEKNISRTGEHIHLSQSATSGVLARLREYFNDQLLVPVGRQMMLTPLAEELAEPVRQFLRQAEGILHRNPEFVPAESAREFRLIMSDYVATVLMSRAMPMLEQQAPNVSIRIDTGGRRDALERGGADLVILPEQYLLPTHPKEELFRDELACLACAKNRTVGRTITMKTTSAIAPTSRRRARRLSRIASGLSANQKNPKKVRAALRRCGVYGLCREPRFTARAASAATITSATV